MNLVDYAACRVCLPSESASRCARAAPPERQSQVLCSISSLPCPLLVNEAPFAVLFGCRFAVLKLSGFIKAWSNHPLLALVDKSPFARLGLHRGKAFAEFADVAVLRTWGSAGTEQKDCQSGCDGAKGVFHGCSLCESWIKAPPPKSSGAWRLICAQVGCYRDQGRRGCLFGWGRFQGLCACFSPSPGIKDEQHQARDSYPVLLFFGCGGGGKPRRW